MREDQTDDQEPLPLLRKLVPGEGFMPVPVLPFTVTKPVTSGRTPIEIVSRDTRLAFGKIFAKEDRWFQSCLPMIADSRGHRPDCPLGNALKTAEGP